MIGGSGALAEAVLPFSGKLTDAVFAAVEGQFELPRWTAEHSPRAKAVLFDASGLTRFEQLVALRDSSSRCSRASTSARRWWSSDAPESLKDPVAASVQRSLEGFTRSLGKEIRRGGNVQLLYVGKGAEDQLEGALRFFLSPKSAYVSGQVIRLAANSAQVHDWSKPLAGQRALVTGAARGIGAAIAETLARDGAEVVLLDVPPARRPSKASPRASAAVPWPSTSAPRTPGSNWWTCCLRASISSCTTPGSPATRPWRR